MTDKRWKATERRIAAIRRDDQPDVAPETGEQEPRRARYIPDRKGEELPWEELDEEDQALFRAAGRKPTPDRSGRG